MSGWRSAGPNLVGKAGLFVSMFLFGLSLLNAPGFALPQDYHTVSGQVQFSSGPKKLDVTATKQKTIVNYQSFNIAADETVNFNLSNAQSAILNRVIGGNPSAIFGHLSSNGQVFLINPAGILFGSSAQVNVGSLLASTLNISDQDFLNGNYRFYQDPAFGPAAVQNSGNLNAGSITLLGAAVQNDGTITANQINMAVGQNISVLVDDKLAVDVTVDQALAQQVTGIQNAINNTGTLQGSSITLQAALAQNLYQRSINNEGVIQSSGLQVGGGSVKLIASAGNTFAGTVRNAGTIDVSGVDPGSILLSGDYVIQRGKLLAEGQEGGKGGHIELTSTGGTLLTDGSLTSVRGAGDNSDAGSVRIWSDTQTLFEKGAVIDARGGSVSGDGGYVEVSSGGGMVFEGQAFGGATNGKGGTILLDPKDIILLAGGTDTIPGGNQPLGVPEETLFDRAGTVLQFDPSAGGAFNGFQNIYLQATEDISVSSTFDTAIATGNGGLVSVYLYAYRSILLFSSIISHGGEIDLFASASGNGTGGINMQNFAQILSNGGKIVLSGHTIVQDNANNIINPGTGEEDLNGICVLNCPQNTSIQTLTSSQANTLRAAGATNLNSTALPFLFNPNTHVAVQFSPTAYAPPLPPPTNGMENQAPQNYTPSSPILQGVDLINGPISLSNLVGAKMNDAQKKAIIENSYPNIPPNLDNALMTDAQKIALIKSVQDVQTDLKFLLDNDQLAQYLMYKGDLTDAEINKVNTFLPQYYQAKTNFMAKIETISQYNPDFAINLLTANYSKLYDPGHTFVTTNLSGEGNIPNGNEVVHDVAHLATTGDIKGGTVSGTFTPEPGFLTGIRDYLLNYAIDKRLAMGCKNLAEQMHYMTLPQQLQMNSIFSTLTGK